MNKGMFLSIAEKRMDASEVKAAAAGKWSEILPAVAGIDHELMDGKNRECPKCGGKDRFRAIDIPVGALLCNQCFREKNGDGFAAIQWLTGCTFPEAVGMVARYLHLEHGNGNGHNGNGKAKPKAEDKAARLAASIAKLNTFDESQGAPGWFAKYAASKPPITVDGIRKCGGQVVNWFSQFCVRFDGRANIGDEQPAAVVLLRADGKPFPATGQLQERKSHSLAGSVNSWITSGDVEAADVVLDVEGIPDLLAVASMLPPGWVAVTNTGGAGTRGKLSRKWAKDKRVIVVGDADQPGQEGLRRAILAYSKAGAIVEAAELPYPIEETHGRDLRDWLGEGHKLEELPTVTVKSEQVEEWNKQHPDADRKANITNVWYPPSLESDEEARPLPLPMNVVISRTLADTDGWPRRVGESLFVDDDGVQWIARPAALFGWLARKCGVIQWHRITGCISKEEFFAELQRTATAYNAIEAMPHFPAFEKHYYACKTPEPGDGATLDKLVGFYCPATPLDRELILALFATPLWGGLAGTRPAFLLTCAEGRGRGKSTLSQHVGQLYGGSIDFSQKEDIGIIKQRLLTAETALKRVASLDNLKTTRFSWPEIESIITNDVINGKRLYVGDASRPNLLTWIITLNGASLSTDMAQRVVEIRLGEPQYSGDWESNTKQFIETNREKIFADIVAFLQRNPQPLKRLSRWASWESQVLARVQSPNECLDLVINRRGEVDVEQEEGQVIEDYFAHKLAVLDYDLQRADVFIPNDVATEWYNRATNEHKKTTGVTRTLKQLHDERTIWRIQPARANGTGERGFRWIGEHVAAMEPTSYDLRKRLADRNGNDSVNKGNEGYMGNDGF